METSKIVSLLLQKRACCTLLVAFVVVALFSPGLNGGFVFDDQHNVLKNPALYTYGLDHVSLLRAAMSFPEAPGLRAIPMLSFGLDYFFFDGFSPAGFKLTNIAIHALTFLVLAAFLRRLLIFLGYQEGGAYLLGGVFSLIWAIHPLNVSTVLYVVQRMQMLATLFLLLALWQYLKMRQAQIEGSSGWCQWGGVLFFWLMALLSKEDAILLPVYGFVLELFALRFQAARPVVRRVVSYGYLAVFCVGWMAFLFWFLPKNWHWGNYSGRNFNSYERLLTQGRVLVMYLGQIVYPSPDRMPFYYDNYEVSRAWLQPITTLGAWLLIAILAAGSWFLKGCRPLAALGIVWFLIGHAVTSNVIGLELVFEHRNYLPMLGVVLALGDVALFLYFGLKSNGRHLVIYAGFFVLLFILGFATWQRATVWGNSLGFAERMVEIAPKSSRAWVDLCRTYFELSQGKPQSIEFGKAIEACRRGGEEAGSFMAMTNGILLKATREGQDQSDWDRLLVRLPQFAMRPEDRAVPLSLINSYNQGVPLPVDGILAVVEVVDRNLGLTPGDYVIAARFVLDHTGKTGVAYAYIEKAVRVVPVDDPMLVALREYLRDKGFEGWEVHFSGLEEQGSGSTVGSN